MPWTFISRNYIPANLLETCNSRNKVPANLSSRTVMATCGRDNKNLAPCSVIFDVFV